MKRQTRWFPVALIVLLLPAVILVPLSKAQVTKISTGLLLLPKKLLSLPPRVLGHAMLQSVMPAKEQANNSVIVGTSYHNDTSPPLRDMKPLPVEPREEREANENPKIPHVHKDSPDESVVQDQHISAPNMPAPILNFDGIPFPGVACNCAPPDTNGAVGMTQYVQIVNEGFQVFDKATGAPVLPAPVGITTLWSGFGGVCQTNGDGDPVVLYDKLADRWVVTQFAGVGVPTDECIAVSTTSDATGSFNRYGFHLGTNFFDYPHLGTWPDAYYMSMNVFNSSGTAFLGPQPFAFDRAAMLAGNAATFVTTGITGGSTEEAYLPSDFDGTNPPPAGAPNTFVEWPSGSPLVYKVFHFHVDFGTPVNSTFTQFASPPAAGFTALCPTTRACVPEPNGDHLDAIADRFMFRLAYRNFGDHEAVVTNYTVSSGGVAGIRWIELRNVTNGPVTVFQENTYQPDTTWRWMASAAQDHNGNMALGFSVSSSTVVPGLRYAGRLATDPLNTLAQGEATLFAGVGSQTGTSNRWGDYSDLTVDPVDDCTFWYTNEYYPTGSTQFNWRTRIGNFKFPDCSIGTPTPTVTGTPPTSTPTNTPTRTPTPTPTVCPGANYAISQTAGTIVPGTTDTGNHCDDCDTLIALPFAFKVYDQTLSTVYVSSNGRLDFVTNNDPGGYLTSCLPAPPNQGPYAYTVFSLWHDLRTDVGLSGCSAWSNGCGIFTSTSGSAPNRIFNIEFHTVRFANNAQTQQFEVRLYENSPTQRFDVIYGAINGVAASDTGGVQGPTPLYTQDFCNTTAPSNVSHTYTLAGCGTPTPTPTNTPTGAPTNTPTRTPTNTPTNTPTGAPTNTPTPTPTNTPTSRLLTALSPAKVWVGAISGDTGLKLDLKAEVLISDTLVGTGELDNVNSPAGAFKANMLNTINLTLNGPAPLPPGAQLQLRVSARRTCSSGGRASGTAQLWYNGQPVDTGTGADAGSRFDATIAGSNRNYFLRTGSILSTTAGSARTSIDELLDSSAPCPTRPFISFGTWSITP